MGKERFKIISAVHLFLVQKGKILLLKRMNTGYEDGNYSVVAGHIDGNEEVKTAMIREAEEEAGITIWPDQLKVVGVMHRKSTEERIDFFLAAEEWTGEIKNLEPDKCEELQWFDLEQLPANVIPYVKQAIENYRNNIWFHSFGWQE